MVRDTSLDINDYVQGYIRRFAQDVADFGEGNAVHLEALFGPRETETKLAILM